MDKIYDHKKVEEKIYDTWEKSGYFKPEINPDGVPYSIILPPPNANAPLHFGHAMYVVEDILIRYHRMLGEAALWFPGADHAGFETQFVFEKHLTVEGKSRFDYDRETLYQMIWDFVQKNRGGMESQLRNLGFSLDWSRLKFTLDPDIVKIVYRTFKKLHNDDLLYRAKRLVNYCTFDGTSFSDLEVLHEEKEDKIYHVKYPFSNKEGFIVVATTRPETMFGDTAVAVNPGDKRYEGLEGTKIKLPLADREVPLIYDETVEVEFGTGAVKVTPGHDPADFERGTRHKLEALTVIGFDGKMIGAGKYDGLFFKQARKQVVEDLQGQGLIEKEEVIKHQVPTCYKCKNVIQPLLMEQWFIKMEPLAKKGIEAVKSGKIKIHPKNFEKLYFQFLENIRDWNISRQVVWGIRIPAWFCEKCSNWIVSDGNAPENCSNCNSKELTQDQDTFDTWFSSAQWPFATLETTEDFGKFYPTTVMETGYDILRWWVARMIMVGLYATDDIPFENVVLHGLVNDPLGKKMSKSKGNVVNPMELVDEYGADAVRFALVYGTALGHDQALSYPRLQGMRNFTNKLWNIGRFIIDFKPEGSAAKISDHKDDKEIIEKFNTVSENVSKALDTYRFHDAADSLYEFIWHEFADKYVEKVKERRGEAQPTLEYVFKESLKLLHPFMPFITEELHQKFEPKKSIMIERWPTNA